ncbi:MAG TPA: hypothetical protein VNM14_19480 [Planctomycetota bacterium]|nr:hypothetical protein [Planctomycetota bacterium]
MIGLLLLSVLAADDGSAGDGAVDQQVRLSLRSGAIQVDYSVQLGRQAAFAEALQMDRDRDGRLSPEEQAEYFAGLEKTILRGLELRVDGRELALRRVGELKLEMPFRKLYRFEAACPSAGRLEFHNENFPDSPGAASIMVEATPTLDVFLTSDPSALRRDLVGELRPGTGVVELRRSPARLAAPSAAAGVTLRLLSLAGFLGGALLAFRRRRRAAVLSWAAAAACGAAAIIATLPSTSESERIFCTLHDDEARASDPSLRRVKPLETRILPSVGFWSPEFEVRHRWATYGSTSHSGHAHAEVKEREGRFRVRWSGGSWRLVDLEGPEA